MYGNEIICQVDDHHNKLLEVEKLMLALFSWCDLKCNWTVVVVVLTCPNVHPYPQAEEYSETWLESMNTVFSHSHTPDVPMAVFF